MSITKARMSSRFDNEQTWAAINPTLMYGEAAVTLATSSTCTLTSTGQASIPVGSTITIVKDGITYKFTFIDSTHATCNFNVSAGDQFETDGGVAFTVASIVHAWCKPKVKWGRDAQWSSTPYQGVDDIEQIQYLYVANGPDLVISCDEKHPGPFLLGPGIWKEASSGQQIKIQGCYGFVWWSNGAVHYENHGIVATTSGNSDTIAISQRFVSNLATSLQNAINQKINASDKSNSYTSSSTSTVATSKALKDGLDTRVTLAQLTTAVNNAMAYVQRSYLHDAMEIATRMNPYMELTTTVQQLESDWNGGTAVGVDLLTKEGLSHLEVKGEDQFPESDANIFIRVEGDESVLFAVKLSSVPEYYVTVCDNENVIYIGTFLAESSKIVNQPKGCVIS